MLEALRIVRPEWYSDRMQVLAVLAWNDHPLQPSLRREEEWLGVTWPEGVELSFGQWQKLALARGFMRDRPLVLVLDEPTAALDARAEYEVFKRFKELSAGKTALLISHRFSSVRMADRIVVLGEGRLEAIGTHEELLARGGRYKELFELQAAGYR